MALVEAAPAKINLTLRVLGRRADGFHDLESLVAFADLADRLTLVPGPDTALELGGPFAVACGAVSENLILKAVRAAGLRGGLFSLDKQIPVAAGLGGGSADAAAALRLIARANGLKANDPRMLDAARAIGADVPVCLEGRARIMRGIGELLSPPLALPRLPAVLVNPRIALPTARVFARLALREEGVPLSDDVPPGQKALLAWLAARGNDLTRAARECAPEIADVLSALQKLPGCRLARMTGSGATCFALFDDAAAAATAAGCLTQSRGNWWIYPTLLG